MKIRLLPKSQQTTPERVELPIEIIQDNRRFISLAEAAELGAALVVSAANELERRAKESNP